MIRFQKRNTIWLAGMSVLMAIAALSPNVTIGVQALLFSVFLLALGGSLMDENTRERLVSVVQNRFSTTHRGQMSNDARQAYERARAREYRTAEVQMIDIGVIASQTGADGMVMRRATSISKDDDGARPFLTLVVPPEEAERNAIIRFEFIDQNGDRQYVHTMRVYLREGEMNILADHHLPLMDNERIAGMGDWDLRVYVDDVLIGIHTFSLHPSMTERRQRLRGGQYYEMGEARPRRSSDTPTSLEDLLRNQDKR